MWGDLIKVKTELLGDIPKVRIRVLLSYLLKVRTRVCGVTYPRSGPGYVRCLTQDQDQGIWGDLPKVRTMVCGVTYPRSGPGYVG